jgi:luciferase family oxidoreductase group 1
MNLHLSILDQSPVISGHAPAHAVAETLKLAQAADALGYHRYWLAEHHAVAALADPCPEILLTRVASATARIRVGTGGVLLPYYSALKVAEVFRMLEALFPGRIDLGLGRAPGGDLLTAQALSSGAYSAAERFAEQVQDLVGFLDDALPEDHAYARVKAMPAGPASPPIWLLGSSDYSGALAAALGLRFAFAHFINALGGDAVTRAYRARFSPSAREAAPHAVVCAFVICAETAAAAEKLAACVDLRRLHMAQGLNTPIPTLAEAQAQQYSERELAYIRSQRARTIIGDPRQVRERLRQLREQYEADELMILTITGDYASRLRSYELLAREFELQ